MLSGRLKILLGERDISIQEFAEMCDLPLETVRSVYYGKTSDVKLSTAYKMAEALNLSVNCLMGKCQHTMQERVLLQHYRACGKHGKSIIELIARYEAGAIQVERNRHDKHKIPCILPRGEIRKGIVYDLCETIEIETSIKDAFVGIQMTDNDLAPRYCKDDILLFEDRFPKNGEIAAFFMSDRVFIRKFIEEDGHYVLKSLFPNREDVILKRMDELDYIGTCIEVVRT